MSTNTPLPASRLAYLRHESNAERLSYGEIAEIEHAFEQLDPATFVADDVPENATITDMLDELEAAAAGRTSKVESSKNKADVTTVVGLFEGAKAVVVVPGGFRPIRASVGWETSPGLHSAGNMNRAQAQALVDTLQAALDETGPR